jgi:hypothetical protein
MIGNSYKIENSQMLIFKLLIAVAVFLNRRKLSNRKSATTQAYWSSHE